MNDSGFALLPRLKIHLPGLDRDGAYAVVDTAHRLCPYTKASRVNIDVTINLVSSDWRECQNDRPARIIRAGGIRPSS